MSHNLIALGWRVACCDVQEAAGAKVVAELGANAAFYKCDVSIYEDQVAVFKETWEKWGRLDAFLANAGFSDRGSIYIFNHRGSKDIPPKPALLSTEACYKGFLYGVQLAIHFMRQNRNPGGSIIATSSIASLHPHQTFPEYNGAKAAVSDIFITYINDVSENLLDQPIRANHRANTGFGKSIPTLVVAPANTKSEGKHNYKCCSSWNSYDWSGATSVHRCNFARTVSTPQCYKSIH